MAKVYYDQDASLDVLKGRKVAIIGYGSQGHAQAQNLKDSGLDVIIGLRKGRSWDKAQNDGFNVVSVKEAAKKGDIVQMLLPDQHQAAVYAAEIESAKTEIENLSAALEKVSQYDDIQKQIKSKISELKNKQKKYQRTLLDFNKKSAFKI